jgi:hypothetical protein
LILSIVLNIFNGHCREGIISAFSLDRVRFSSAEATQAEVDAVWQLIKDMFPHGHENSPVMGASLHIVSETYSVCLNGLVDLNPAALYDQFSDIITLRPRDGMCVFSRRFFSPGPEITRYVVDVIVPLLCQEACLGDLN